MQEDYLISIEGTEGCGKGTQCQRLLERLQKAGHAAILTREPGGTEVGEEVRSVLKRPRNGKLNPLTELLLMTACRAQLIEETIRPALENRRIVICDRYSDSTRVYQGWGRGLNQETIETVLKAATGGMEPGLTIVYQLDRERARERVSRRANGTTITDRFDGETEAFFARVAEGYNRLQEDHPQRNWCYIDADGTIEEVAEATWEAVIKYIKKKDWRTSKSATS